MKVTIIRNINDVCDIDTKNPKSVLTTRDGAKLIDLKVSGADLPSTIAMLIKSVLESVKEVKADSVFYMSIGNILMNPAETTYSVVVGISGVSDLDSRLRADRLAEGTPMPVTPPVPTESVAPTENTSVEAEES